MIGHTKKQRNRQTEVATLHIDVMNNEKELN